MLFDDPASNEICAVSAVIEHGGGGRPQHPFWSVQHENVLILQRIAPLGRSTLGSYNTDAVGIGFEGKALKKVEEGGWIFASNGKAFVGVKFLDGGYVWDEKRAVATPANFNKATDKSRILLHAGDIASHGSFDKFKADVLASRLNVTPDKVDYQFGPAANHLEVTLYDAKALDRFIIAPHQRQAGGPATGQDLPEPLSQRGLRERQDFGERRPDASAVGLFKVRHWTRQTTSPRITMKFTILSSAVLLAPLAALHAAPPPVTAGTPPDLVVGDLQLVFREGIDPAKLDALVADTRKRSNEMRAQGFKEALAMGPTKTSLPWLIPWIIATLYEGDKAKEANAWLRNNPKQLQGLGIKILAMFGHEGKYPGRLEADVEADLKARAWEFASGFLDPEGEYQRWTVQISW